MKPTLLQHLKSKTVLWSIGAAPTLLALVDVLSQNILLVKQNLGGAYGIVSLILMVGGVLLRRATDTHLATK